MDEFEWDPIDEAPVPVRARLRRWAHNVAERMAEHPVREYGSTVTYADGTTITRPTVYN
jgi:hypothetical protein